MSPLMINPSIHLTMHLVAGAMEERVGRAAAPVCLVIEPAYRRTLPAPPTARPMPMPVMICTITTEKAYIEPEIRHSLRDRSRPTCRSGKNLSPKRFKQRRAAKRGK